MATSSLEGFPLVRRMSKCTVGVNRYKANQHVNLVKSEHDTDPTQSHCRFQKSKYLYKCFRLLESQINSQNLQLSNDSGMARYIRVQGNPPFKIGDETSLADQILVTSPQNYTGLVSTPSPWHQPRRLKIRRRNIHNTRSPPSSPQFL